MYMYVIRLLKVIEVSFGSCMLTVKPGLHPQALHVNGALSDLPSYLFICLVKFLLLFSFVLSNRLQRSAYLFIKNTLVLRMNCLSLT